MSPWQFKDKEKIPHPEKQVSLKGDRTHRTVHPLNRFGMLQKISFV